MAQGQSGTVENIELVAEGFGWAEGPVAMKDGSVILTDMAAATLVRVWPDGRKEIVAETGGGPNGLAIGPDGALYVTNNGGSFTMLKMDGLSIPGPTPPSHKGGYIQRVDIKTGKVKTLYDNCDGKRLVGPNDLVFDKQGGMWFTDHGCQTHETRTFGGLYYAKPDGSHISCQRHGLLSPNGVGLSPDETVVYMADTYTARLWAFDVESPGKLTPATPIMPGRVIVTLPGYQMFDSLAVEADGKVCVGTIINGGITPISPDGTFEHYPFSDPIVTNICFGGADMRDAWVTCSGTGMLYKCRWPRPGLKLNFNA